MISAGRPADEDARLRALRRYEILDTPAEAEFDDLTRLAALLCGAPICLISLVDGARQWFKSRVGLDATETPREVAFCAHAILGDAVMEVPDALEDERFRDNPFVRGPSGVRFYAGAPLTTPEGFKIGTLCVIDRAPRHLTPEQRGALALLGRVAIRQMESRLATREGAAAVSALGSAAVLESMGDGVHVLDSSGHIVFENRAAAEMFGASAASLVGKPAHETVHHSHADGSPYPKEECPIYLTLSDGAVRRVPNEILWRADGTAFHVELVATPVRAADGEIRHVAVVFHDVTERRRGEEATARLAAIVESSDYAIIGKDITGRITSWNAAAERMFGYSAAEAVGQSITLVIPPALHHEEVEILRRIARGERIAHFETERRRKDGSVFPASITSSPIRGAGGIVVGASKILQDITARKEAERIAEQHARLSAFEAEAGLALTVETNLAASLQRCAEGLVQHLGAAFARIWVLDEAEAVLVLRASAGQYTHLDGAHARVQLGKCEIGLIAEERRPHVTSSAIGDPRVADQAWAKREGMIAFAGYPLVAGDRLVGVMAMFAREPLDGPTLEAMASVAHAVALAIDRDRIVQLLRAKNDELKAFTYTVSHDLKAPLRGIVGYSQELERRHQAGLDARGKFCVSQVITATRNLDRLIEDLLQYSRLERETPALTAVDLEAMVQAIVRERAPAIAERKTEVSVAMPNATVTGWERGLLQVFSNLIDNAIKYSSKATPPRVQITGERGDGVYRVAIADNGIGFDMQYHDRMFGLFNRLVRAEDFEGTGAGLAIVKKVLDKQRGRVWARAEPGRGATFFVELPDHAKSQEDPPS